ncbi:unnamed protein product [Urochloa decumbens]|uniref:Exocyst complex component Sec8 n=1 Tax=Urochloa decumbens TaxID=240449 RepID=A0ABC9EUZ1_9POAL
MYQVAHRQMRAAVYLVCLRRRVEVASDLGLLPSGRERRLILEEIGVINAAAPVYHWVVSRCHDRLRGILGDDLYMEIVAATPKDEEGWRWIVQTGSDIIVAVTTLMAEIQFSIMHNETWRAAVRDHPLYDVCPLFLNKLAGSVAEFSTNIALACFKRPFSPIIQRMVENHALAVVHLHEVLLDFYEVLSSGEQADNPKVTKELLMRYDFLFVQDLDPQDYISGPGAADAADLLLLVDALKPEVRAFRRTWN